MSTPQENALGSFVQIWKTAFGKVLAQLGANEVNTPDADPAKIAGAGPDDQAMLAVRFTGGGCLKGQLHWSTEKSVAVQFAQLLMSEPLDAAAEFTSMHLDGYLEFLRQVAGEVAVAWKQLHQLPTELNHQPEVPGAMPVEATAAFLVESDKCKGLAVRLDVDAEMLAAISAAPEPQQEDARTVEEDPASTEGAKNLPANLDLILDVQLDATIRFGQREMLLKDVFALMPGAVVELEQLVNEPAELLIAGRRVATGEVVVVDGNFGLRVKEVSSPAQRVMALPLP
jgi:flagellar motor switch protein FliN/FliY